VALACVVLLLPFEVLTGGPGGILGNPIGINDPVGDLLPFEQLSGIGLFIGILEIILAAILFTALFSGMVSLVLNIPLFRKTVRESARLKQLGLSSLSQSLLLKES